MDNFSKVIVALDQLSSEEVFTHARKSFDEFSILKVGLELFNKHGIDFEETHLDGNRLENFKKQFTTLPQIYDDEENHIGGYQDLYHLLK